MRVTTAKPEGSTEIVVFSVLNASVCSSCKASIDKGELLRMEKDAHHVEAFARAIQAAYPECPTADAEAIAAHACLKCSGRVGRSAAARSFSPEAITLAVAAHVRHRHSQYDQLLAQGWDRSDARHTVAGKVDAVLQLWRNG